MNNTPRERFRKTLDISTGVSEFLADSNTSYISWLERELTAVTEQLKETQEALAAEIKHHTDIRTAVGDPTAKLMQDELVERCRRMSAVIDAARCIRHWHDREPDGMVVSKSHVFALWQTLNELDKPNVKVSAPARKEGE